MKVKNLLDYPAQLGDGRMIGATGAHGSDERKYGLPVLSKEDKQRVKSGWLEILEEEEEKPTISEENTATQSNKPGGKK